MKIVLLFLVTLIIFFLYLIPIIWPFYSIHFSTDAIGTAYTFWYIMVFILWGDVVYRKGCWFFQK